MRRQTIGALCAMLATLTLAAGCKSASSDKGQSQVPTSDGSVAYGPPAPGDPGAQPAAQSAAADEIAVSPSGSPSTGHFDPAAAKHIETMESGLKALEPIPTDVASLNATGS